LTDPLAGSAWSSRSTVAGFAAGSPNPTLIELARAGPAATSHLRALDIGCGAGRNAVPLAALGWDVLGLDLSRPMLDAAAARATDAGVRERVHLALAPMDYLPVADDSCDLIVAHGIWNLARSSAEFRRGVAEAARVARHHARLFVFTFSRNTLDPSAQPVDGETFVFTSFSGEPQCFLTEEELMTELSATGFRADPVLPLHELNRRRPGALTTSGSPVIWEGMFRYEPVRQG
jgi:ubiquinone/menaquinone biosynthesis C-methylase UbiE